MIAKEIKIIKVKKCDECPRLITNLVKGSYCQELEKKIYFGIRDEFGFDIGYEKIIHPDCPLESYYDAI